VSEKTNGSPFEGADRLWPLPPLILHPFGTQAGPGKLLEGSKAALMLAGLLPDDGADRDELTRNLLEGRYCEVRMIYFVGKDVQRWIEQCVEMVARVPELAEHSIRQASFSRLLVDDPPESVRKKLTDWGVLDSKLVFARAIGLNAVFRKVPTAETLSDDFILYYHRYADHLFACWQMRESFAEIRSKNFQFDLYASGEFSRMLQEQWGE
jgi:hypothetical protein